jgi:hypothetical protein
MDQNQNQDPDPNQNQNDNLFNFDNQPQQPSSDEPTLFSGSAQVYETPEPQQEPVVPPPPPSGPAQVYTPPPAYGEPPVYTPPPLTAQPPSNKSSRTWLIILVVVIVLCCCCFAFMAVMYFWLGDMIINNMDLSMLFNMLA